MSAWSNVLDGVQGTPSPTPDQADSVRIKAATQIFNFERELDTRGHLAIQIDAPDDGGIREVAGITLRYDGAVETHLEALVNAGQFDQAQTEAIAYIATETDAVLPWCHHPAIEANLRDIQFHRGSTGCLKMLQHAIGVTVDNVFGPITESTEKAAEADPSAMLDDLYKARIWFELSFIGTRPNFNRGLMNRFSNARDFAKGLIVKVQP